MAIPSFTSRAVVEFLPAPGADPNLLKLLHEDRAEGELGNLVEWLTTTADPERRPYFRLHLDDGTVLDHVAIAELSHTAEFAAWKARE